MRMCALISILTVCLFAQASYAQDELPLSNEIDDQVERATDTQRDVPLFKNAEEKSEIEEGETNIDAEPAKELIGDFEGTVTHVFDADMIEIDGERMRLLGVNAPESTFNGNSDDCYSDNATRFLEALVLNKQVTYSFDRTYGRRDRYGDTRVYLYINGTFVNEELIAKGQAFTDTSKNYSEKEEFEALQVIARRKHLGLWHTCPVECDRQGVCRTRKW
ncbi:MAG: thermonuclease family protein [Pseudomonadota bacterium]